MGRRAIGVVIAERLNAVCARIAQACDTFARDPGEVELLPVSKRHPIAAIEAVRALGIEAFGENRVQELSEKGPQLPEVQWHFIGSLQTNKVSQLLRVPGLAMLQTLDRIKLADTLQAALAEQAATLDVLLQVNATGEANKHGATPDEARALLGHVVADCPALRVAGLMAMGPLEGDPVPVFQTVAVLHDDLRQESGLALPIRSMGMTSDLEAAIARGSTMVRVGTAIFGARP